MHTLARRASQLALPLVVLAVLLALPAGASAATFTVTTLLDAGSGSLRQAVLNAEGSAGADIITVPPGNIPVSTGEMVITQDLVILATGANPVIDASGFSRIFRITGGSVELNRLTITQGAAVDASPGGAIGGAILQQGGSLRILNSVITDSTANSAGMTAGGGGIGATVGTLLELVDTTISGSSADAGTGVARGGGLVSGPVTGVNSLILTDTTLSGNTAIGDTYAAGGGAYILGTGAESATITRATITGNTAESLAQAWGGGLFVVNDTTSITSSLIESNSSIATTGTADAAGAGLSMFSGTTNITGSTIRSNTITSDAAGRGAGIMVESGTAFIATSSTVSGNSIVATGTASGGGIASSGAANLDVSNSTISGNALTGASTSGSGFRTASTPATEDLNHVTISGNTGGIAVVGLSNVARSILLGNTGGDCDDITSGGYNLVPIGGCTGTSTPSATDIQSVSAQLGALTSNGGPTQTALPGPFSRALDAAEAGPCALATDQRGTTRPSGRRCDIGAVEVVPGVISAAPASITFVPLIVGNGPTTTVTFTNAGPSPVGGPVVAGHLAFSGASASQFAVAPGTDTCTGATLAVSGTCSIGVRFLATSLGTSSATLTMGFSSSDVAIALSATGLPPIPVCSNQSATANLGATTTIALACTGLISSFQVLDSPSLGKLTRTGGSLAYTPTLTKLGTETLRFRASNVTGISPIATLTIRLARGGPMVALVTMPTQLRTSGMVRGTCAIDAGAIDRCTITARVGRVVVARGSTSVALDETRTSIRLLMRPTAAGRARAAATPGGVIARWTTEVRSRDARRNLTGSIRIIPPTQRIEPPRTPMFDASGAVLTADGLNYVQRAARALKGTRIASIECIGHSAAWLSAFGDAQLGIQRAKTACAELRRLGIRTTYRYTSPGGIEPRSSNDSEYGRSLNRRVDLVIRYRA